MVQVKLNSQPECPLTTHSSVVLAFPVVTFYLGVTACLLCLPIAAVMVKAAPGNNRNGLALMHAVVIYSHIIWMVLSGTFLWVIGIK